MAAQRTVVALGHESYYELSPSELDCDATEFEALRAFMRDIVKDSPNPRNPRGAPLKRKQCTFVRPGAAEYEFGQYNQTFRDNAPWPPIVARALECARAHAARFGVDSVLYNGVHVNLYKNGSVGVKPHFDNEKSLVPGAPIFSFTLLSDPTLPRPFSIYTLAAEKLQDVSLAHGSMLVMYGNMQTHFKHGVEAAKPPRLYKNLARINLTVRAFSPLAQRLDSTLKRKRD